MAVPATSRPYQVHQLKHQPLERRPGYCFGALARAGRCGDLVVSWGYCLRCWCALVAWAEEAEVI